MRLGSILVSAILLFATHAWAEGPRGQDPLDLAKEVDETLKRHMSDVNRSRDYATYNILLRAGLLYDALPNAGGFGLYKTAVSTSMLPYSLMAGEKVLDSMKRTLGERTGRNLNAMLGRTLAPMLPSNSTGILTSRDIEKRYAIARRLDGLSRREDLTKEEREALQRQWRGAVDANTKFSLEQIESTNADLSDIADAQLETEKAVEQLGDRLGPVETSVAALSDRLEKLNKVDPHWMANAWTEADFERQLELARSCERPTSSTKDACGVIPKGDLEKILARGDVVSAANAIEQAASVYAGGALQIAANLGIDVPEWTSQAVAGISSAATIAGGIASGRPDQVIAGLVSLTGLFRKPQPSQELLLLQKIDKRLDQIDKRLGKIEQQLDKIVENQQKTMVQLGRIESKLDSLSNLLNAVYSSLHASRFAEIRGCAKIFYPDSQVGLWRPFFKKNITDGKENPELTDMLRTDCLKFVIKTFSDPADDTIVRTSATRASKLQADKIVDREKAAGEALAELLAALPEAERPGLEPYLLADASQRVELVQRFGLRKKLLWTDLTALDRVRNMSSFVALDIALPVTATVAMFYKELPLDRRTLEALTNMQFLLRRSIEQKLLFDGDAAMPILATFFVEGLDPKLLAPLCMRFIELASRDLPDRRAEVSKTLVNDIIDASFFRAWPDAHEFYRKRFAFELAWQSQSADTMALQLAEHGEGSTSPNMLLEVTANATSNEIRVCAKSELAVERLAGLSDRCIEFSDYAKRRQYTQPDDVQMARYWVNVLGAERVSARADALTTK